VRFLMGIVIASLSFRARFVVTPEALPRTAGKGVMPVSGAVGGPDTGESITHGQGRPRSTLQGPSP
jgi:hypothetical protein